MQLDAGGSSNGNAAAVPLPQPFHALQGGGFPSAVDPQQGKDFPLADLKCQPVEHGVFAVAFL